MKELAVIPDHTSRDVSRLDALSPAVNVEIADIKAGRYKIFDSTDALRSHLKSTTAQALF